MSPSSNSTVMRSSFSSISELPVHKRRTDGQLETGRLVVVMCFLSVRYVGLMRGHHQVQLLGLRLIQ